MNFDVPWDTVRSRYFFFLKHVSWCIWVTQPLISWYQSTSSHPGSYKCTLLFLVPCAVQFICICTHPVHYGTWPALSVSDKDLLYSNTIVMLTSASATPFLDTMASVSLQVFIVAFLAGTLQIYIAKADDHSALVGKWRHTKSENFEEYLAANGRFGGNVPLGYLWWHGILWKSRR